LTAQQAGRTAGRGGKREKKDERVCEWSGSADEDAIEGLAEGALKLLVEGT